METILYIIIPCYNEEKVLPVTSGQFLEELKRLIDSERISDDSKIVSCIMYRMQSIKIY